MLQRIDTKRAGFQIAWDAKSSTFTTTASARGVVTNVCRVRQITANPDGTITVSTDRETP